ncbi:MAG: T9SS type A sorting domain-containing protein [Bacteroidetes bacterium]|nr:T9SS type A sorting domain-containing protein [Bacteroidota bacterium]
MKNIQHSILTALAVIFFAGSLFGQSQTLHKSEALMQPMPMKRTMDMPMPPNADATDNPVISTRDTKMDVLIGSSVYDLQTNYSICNRMSIDGDGNIMAVWTMGNSSGDGYSDRGTGYNRYDAGTESWMAPPISRLEDGSRTGWPNHIVTDSGTEFIVNHVFGNPEYKLHYLRREAGDTEWTESDIPSNTPFGSLWPRAASSGETVHVISVATSTALGGDLYEGMNLHPLYYRSSDGGDTWEVQDFIIPGLDTTYMIDLFSSDSYAIDARGDKVVVGIFSQFNDTKVFISEDGGDTWSETRIQDFPIDKYVIDSGYEFDDLPPLDPNSPDSLAIFTTDNTGHVMIDKDGGAHVFFGEMWVLDDVLTDGNYSYFPGTSGLSYWNENFGPDSTRTIADAPDLNGNDTLDVEGIGNIALYYMSLSSMPSAGVDDDNNLYLMYSALMEGPEFIDADDDQHFRHTFMIKSENGGETWSEPYDAINEYTIGDPLFVPFVEAVFPHVLRDLPGEDVLYMYMQDFQPGLSVRGDEDLPGENNIIFSQIGEDPIGSGIPILTEKYGLEVFPNPASESAQIQFELPLTTQVKLDLYNAMGQYVQAVSNRAYAEGPQQETVDLSGLASGMYFVRMQVGPNASVIRLLVD